MTAPTAPAPITSAQAGASAERVERLASDAAEAAAVRALTTHPDVIALRVETVRAQVDALLWACILLGLAFTMVNVQTFAAIGAPRWSAGWWVAWLLDPMVSLGLLAVLRAEQVTARYQVQLTASARRTKWLTFTATYVMNTWTSWGLAGSPFTAAGVVLHSVPPLVVFATAETGPGLRDRLTEARSPRAHAYGAHTRTDNPAPVPPPVTVHEPGSVVAREQVASGVHEPPVNPPPVCRAAGRRPGDPGGASAESVDTPTHRPKAGA